MESARTLVDAIVHNKHLSIAKFEKIDPHKKNKEGFSPVDLIKFLGRDGFSCFLPEEKEEHFIVYDEMSFKRMNIIQFEQKFKIRYLNHLQFKDYAIFDWVIKKGKKKLLKKEYQLANDWTLSLFKKEFSKGKTPKLSVKWINPLIGYGVFAEEDLPELCYIGEYTGIVRKRNKRQDRFNPFVFGYVVGPDDTPYVIDAKTHGNIVRFINHSDDPNLTSKWVIYENVSHVILCANQFISKGNQLTYDYGPLYWKNRYTPLVL